MKRPFWTALALNVGLAFMMFASCSAMQDASSDTYRAPSVCEDAAREALEAREGAGVDVEFYSDSSDGVTSELHLEWHRRGRDRSHFGEATCRVAVDDGELVVEELVLS